LKVVSVVIIAAELFVAADREFHSAGTMMLNALDWKLIVVVGFKRFVKCETFEHFLSYKHAPHKSWVDLSSEAGTRRWRRPAS